jgi:hypothetical protein
MNVKNPLNGSLKDQKHEKDIFYGFFCSQFFLLLVLSFFTFFFSKIMAQSKALLFFN